MTYWHAMAHGMWVILLIKLMSPSVVKLLDHTNYANFTLRIEVRPKEDHRLILQPKGTRFE